MALTVLAVAVLAALEHRTRTGEGQYVELSQSEAAAFLLGHFYLQEPCTGRPVEQQGNASADAWDGAMCRLDRRIDCPWADRVCR